MIVEDVKMAILGVDFLKRNEAVVDVKTGKLRLHSEEANHEVSNADDEDFQFVASIADGVVRLI